jgi:hypothetical protein
MGILAPIYQQKRNREKSKTESARFYIRESAGLIQIILEDGDKLQVVQGKEKKFANI